MSNIGKTVSYKKPGVQNFFVNIVIFLYKIEFVWIYKEIMMRAQWSRESHKERLEMDVNCPGQKTKCKMVSVVIKF